MRAAAKGEAAAFLPTTRREMKARCWDALDILIITGDAYVDHPAFGPVLIARCLEADGYRVGIVPQPDWRSTSAVSVMGRPRLFVGVSAGNLDSMLNKLTAQKKVRSQDQYSPGGRRSSRPNRAGIVYSNLCRQAFPGLPVVLGGIEASLRRIAHYDYWSDRVRRSILLDAKADLLVFGMGELAVREIARRLRAGERIERITDVRGTAFVIDDRSRWQEMARAPSRKVSDGRPVVLPSYEEVRENRLQFALATRLFQLETNPANARPLLQVHGRQAVYLNPPARPLTGQEMDRLYDLPFQRRPHPRYRQSVPAYQTVKHALVASRGCFGGCTFCSLTEHQGRAVQSRTPAGVLRELAALKRMDDFKGVVSDLGGPTANMYGMGCKRPRLASACRRLSCLHPRVCENLDTDQRPFLELLRTVRRAPGVRSVLVASGIRHDLALRGPELLQELAAHHTGGMLSVAPEHAVASVLRRMKKPPIDVYERFGRAFDRASRKAGKEQYLIPYFMVGHPGATLADTVELALYLKRNGLRPRQVQEFIPTPMTVATAIYHTGLDPFSLKPVPSVRDAREKRLMKALLLYWDETKWPAAREALRRAGRSDLIGRARGCLVPPPPR
jgi:uncharacterized radical SAM protein YgiQ